MCDLECITGIKSIIIIMLNIDNQGEMERSLTHGFQRLLQLLLLTALLLTFVLIPQTRSQADTEEVKCGIERVTVDIEVDGCEPTTTTIRACNGACLSAVTTVLAPPFSVSHCTSCQPIFYKHNKERVIKLVCNGVEERRTMYFPFIKECGCVNSTVEIN